MADPLTRTGSIREGFEYQDLYGVAVLIEWLEHLERYEWAAFEEDEFGFLDDVVRCTPDLKLTLSQIKHSGISGTSRPEVSLSELLERAKGKKGLKDSLLQKWFKSWVPLYDPGEMIDGVEVHPLVAGVRFLNINTWQFWRGMHPPFFPTFNLFVKDGSVAHDAEGWFYESPGHRLFEGHDWRIGSLERIHDNEYDLTGQYALCDPDWLNTYLERAGLRLAHVLRVSVMQRNREYEDAKEFHNCRLLNLGSIVT